MICLELPVAVMDILNLWQYTWTDIPSVWKPEALLIKNHIAKGGKLEEAKHA